MNYECVCEDCGQAFETNDEDSVLCPICWEKAVNIEHEGKGIEEKDN